MAFVERFELTLPIYKPNLDERQQLITKILWNAYGSDLYTSEEYYEMALMTKNLSSRQIFSNIKNAYLHQCATDMNSGYYVPYFGGYFASYDDLHPDVCYGIDNVPEHTLRASRIPKSALMKHLKKKPRNSAADSTQLNTWMKTNGTKLFIEEEEKSPPRKFSPRKCSCIIL